MHTVYLGLGSNQSDPINQIKNATELIEKIETSKITKKSSLYESLPVGYLDQPNFINQVISVQTSLSPAELFERFQQIEFQLKRVKKIVNGPRTIDIDILLFNQEIILTKDLTIPHPRMLDRAFVMIPLLEIEPNILVPKISNLKEILGKLDIKTLTKIDDQSI